LQCKKTTIGLEVDTTIPPILESPDESIDIKYDQRDNKIYLKCKGSGKWNLTSEDESVIINSFYDEENKIQIWDLSVPPCECDPEVI